MAHGEQGKCFVGIAGFAGVLNYVAICSQIIERTQHTHMPLVE